MIPTLKEYNYFDDGKTNASRLDKVLITEIIPFDKVDRELKDFWRQEVYECDWLYKKKTDYFIKGHLKQTNADVVFVRTIRHGWFSLGFEGGQLDIDGSLTERMNNTPYSVLLAKAIEMFNCDMTTNNRKRTILEPKQVAWYCLRAKSFKGTRITYKMIAEDFNCGQESISRGFDNVGDLLTCNKAFRNKYKAKINEFKAL